MRLNQQSWNFFGVLLFALAWFAGATVALLFIAWIRFLAIHLGIA